MSKVIHRIDFPLSAGAPVRGLDNSIDYRVAEVHIAVGHVNFSTQHHRSLFKLSIVHAHEKVDVFLNRAITERRINAGSSGSAFLLGNLPTGLLVNIRFSLLYEPYGKIEKLREIVACII